MSRLLNKLSILLTAIPVIVVMTVINVFICFATSGVVLIQLQSAGYNKYISLGVAVLVAIGVHVWLVFNHKLREYVKKFDQEIEGVTRDE